MNPEAATGLIVCVMAIVSALAKAAHDTIHHHFRNSDFYYLNHNWWNPVTSWQNKWKNERADDGERFFLSSTWLVWVTDAAHFLDAVRRLWPLSLLSLLYAGPRFAWLGELNAWWLFAALCLNYGVFHVFYTYVFVSDGPSVMERLNTKRLGYTLNNLSGWGVLGVVGLVFAVPALLGVFVNPYLGAGVAGTLIAAAALAEPVNKLFKKE